MEEFEPITTDNMPEKRNNSELDLKNPNLSAITHQCRYMNVRGPINLQRNGGSGCLIKDPPPDCPITPSTSVIIQIKEPL